jgi:VanZ family protein
MKASSMCLLPTAMMIAQMTFLPKRVTSFQDIIDNLAIAMISSDTTGRFLA